MVSYAWNLAESDELSIGEVYVKPSLVGLRQQRYQQHLSLHQHKTWQSVYKETRDNIHV